MNFNESYKNLEKLCGDLLHDDRRITAYIEAMQNTSGSYYVNGWDEDLKQLKHYRWVRNQISHEPGCTEENMCASGDAEWLNHFYERIMHQTDPLALYYQATRPARARRTVQAAPRTTAQAAPQASTNV